MHVERHLLVGVVRLAEACERVGDRILVARDPRVRDALEAALDLVRIVAEGD